MVRAYNECVITKYPQGLPASLDPPTRLAKVRDAIEHRIGVEPSLAKELAQWVEHRYADPVAHPYIKAGAMLEALERKRTDLFAELAL